MKFLCLHCSFDQTVPDSWAGKTCRCQGCREPVKVPDKLLAAVLPIPMVLPVRRVSPVRLDDKSPLAPCAACGHDIAKKATTCPKCGAPNECAHPEIGRFYESIGQFRFGASVVFKHEKWTLAGVDREAGKNEMALADLANSFGVIGNLGDVLAAHYAQRWVRERANKKIKAFRVEFTPATPLWSSTDDEYWFDVMEFFGVNRHAANRVIR